MKISKKDLEARRARVAGGTADDDDRRLVELYGATDDEAPGVTVRDGEEAVATITAMAEAEVVKGSADTRPRKSTRGRTTR